MRPSGEPALSDKKPIYYLTFSKTIAVSAVSKDLQQIVLTFLGYSSIEIWDLAKARKKGDIPKSIRDISSMQFINNDQNLITANSDDNPKIWKFNLWDLKKEQLIKEIASENQKISYISASPDAHLLGYTTNDHVRIFDAKSYNLLYTLEDNAPFRNIIFSSNNLCIFYGRENDKDIIKVWDVEQKTTKAKLSYDFIEISKNIAVSPDGSTIVLFWDRFLLFDLTGKKRLEVQNPFVGHFSNEVTPDFKHIINDSGNSIEVYDIQDIITNRIWDYFREDNLKNHLPRSNVKIGLSDKTLLSASLKEAREVFLGSSNGTLWVPKDDQFIMYKGKHKEAILSATVARDEKRKFYLITGSTSIKLWDLQDFSHYIFKFEKAHKEHIFDLDLWITSLTMDVNNKKVISGSGSSKPRKHAIKIWDLLERKMIASINNIHSDNITNLCTINENLIISASLDQSVKIIDINTHHQVYCFENAHSNPIYSLMLIPNTTYFVTGSGCKRIPGTKIWENKLLRPRQGIQDSDFSIKIWDYSDKEKIHSFTHAHSGSILYIAAHETNMLVSCANDQSIKIWDYVKKFLVRTIAKVHDICPMLVFTEEIDDEMCLVCYGQDKLGMTRKTWGSEVFYPEEPKLDLSSKNSNAESQTIEWLQKELKSVKSRLEHYEKSGQKDTHLPIGVAEEDSDDDSFEFEKEKKLDLVTINPAYNPEGKSEPVEIAVETIDDNPKTSLLNSIFYMLFEDVHKKIADSTSISDTLQEVHQAAIGLITFKTLTDPKIPKLFDIYDNMKFCRQYIDRSEEVKMPEVDEKTAKQLGIFNVDKIQMELVATIFKVGIYLDSISQDKTIQEEKIVPRGSKKTPNQCIFLRKNALGIYQNVRFDLKDHSEGASSPGKKTHHYYVMSRVTDDIRIEILENLKENM